MNAIQIKNVTKKYPNGAGNYDIQFDIEEGKVFGFIGPNGAGKSTLIRQIMGFVKSDNGSIDILGKDAWTKRAEIMKDMGYISGEPIVPEGYTGEQYLKIVCGIRKNVEWDYVLQLVKYFDFDFKRKIKKMSKGMKQKVAIIAAVMHNPKIIILDEPTSGLDPLMQQQFNSLMVKLKTEQKATIFVSSHIFSEIEKMCDRVGFIRGGHLVKDSLMKEIKNFNGANYLLTFKDKMLFEQFCNTYKEQITDIKNENLQLVFNLQTQTQEFLISIMNQFKVIAFKEIEANIEDQFIELYGDKIEMN
ncbi:ABC transporter ATP-binding protein [Spiroplasma endosymbiont of Crioceris asparagi]|uniref:ABC transporter ATP-binding protein n=1 Tax=Spiroplasma endosymbiont of Crioceris asparagi TaxID=3066286 RepID=UPI0030CB0DE4